MRSVDRITVINFVAMMMVVMIHSNLPGTRFAPYVILALTQWAIPWFFLISGVFLTRSLHRYGILELCKKKVMSLIMPYLLWSLLTLPCGGNPPLWFLRSLIYFTFSAILLFVIPVRHRHPAFALVLAIPFGILTFFRCGWFIGTPTSPFWFILGMVASDFILQDRPRSSYVVILSTLVLAVVTRAVWFVVPLHGNMEMILRNCCCIFAIIALWCMCDMFAHNWSPKHPIWKTTFFVYCAHYPFFLVSKPLYTRIAGGGGICAK